MGTQQMLRRSIASVAIVVMCGFSHAGERDVQIGPYSIEIGMEKERVLELLSNRYSLKCTDDSENCWQYLVWTKTQPYEYLGNLIFHDGRLVNVRRSWEGFDSSRSADFADALFSLFKDLENDGLTLDRIVLDEQPPNGPTTSNRHIYFVYGQKIVAVSITRIENDGTLPAGVPEASVNLTEVIEQPEWWKND